MRDRLTAGAIAGFVGGVAQDIFGIVAKALKLTDRGFVDFAERFMLYKNYPGVLAFLIGFIAQALIGAVIGVIFAYLIKFTSSRFYYFKGVGLGLFFWLTLGLAGTAYRLPLFKEVPPAASLMTLIGAILFGVVTAYLFKLLTVKLRVDL
ncbi:MAG TPA: hypothetical protein DEB05_05005 [Firmicutes bacterium]|nr:hypothetical protein [Bacillota bacterium]